MFPTKAEEETRMMAEVQSYIGMFRRVNGPALLMFCDENTPQPPTGTLLMTPMTNYFHITIQASWKTANPSHLAALHLVQTDAEFPGDEGTIWTPLAGVLDQYDPPGGHDPHQLRAENAAIIRCYSVKAHAIGLILFTWPSDAKLQARIWALSYGEKVNP